MYFTLISGLEAHSVFLPRLSVAEPFWTCHVKVFTVVDHGGDKPPVYFVDVDGVPFVSRVSGWEVDPIEQGRQWHQVPSEGPLAQPTRIRQLLQVGAPSLQMQCAISRKMTHTHYKIAINPWATNFSGKKQ